jgi:hypothetical protein
MANVVKIIATNESDRHFEPELLNSDWHGVVSYGLGPRTVCGIQLEGDDGYAGGESKRGFITCPACLGIVREIKAIQHWQPRT